MISVSVSQGLFAFANDYEPETSLEKFSKDLTELIRKSEDDSASSDSIIGDVILDVDQFIDNFGSSASAYDKLPDDAFETERLIVKSKETIDYQGAVDYVNGYNDLYILQYDSQLSAKKAYEYYLKCDFIEYVEPDYIVTASIEDVPGVDVPDDKPNDYDDVTAEAIEWLSDKIGFSDIKEKLEDKIEDDYVLVAVLDSGVDTDHELLVDRLVENDANVSSTGVSDSIEDDYGHGTHVAGIIVNNTLSNVKIKPYKVLNQYGKGSLSSIANAVDMAVADGADVINMSLSGQGESERMTEAVNNAVANDVNVVVAAGNRGADLDEVYISPACVESAITVSATDKNDKLAYFSNYDNTIDIAAPGVDIESSYLNNQYITMSGTSMATPQVTAGIAIIQSIFADKPAAECEEMIKEYAIRMYENDGENHFGAGLLFLKYLLDGKPTTADPIFSVGDCSFSESFTVEINCPDEDADIYYVMYGTDSESINWFDYFEYSSPIKITVDTKVSAIAFADGKYPSSIVTVEYDRIGEIEEDYYEINFLGYITGYYGNETDIVVPETVRGTNVNGIAISAFEGNDTVQTIVLPDCVKKINASAFKDTSSLVSISGSGVIEVSANAFGDSSVEVVDFPNLETIGMYAFENCTNLSSVNLPNVETVGTYAFNQSGITSFTAPELTSIGSNAFIDCYNLVSVSVPKLDVVSLGAFKNCFSLNNVDITSATEIGANAFRNTALEEIEGKNVIKIGNYAFSDSSLLTIAKFPNVTSTGTYIFQNCSELQIVSFPALEELNSSCFVNCPKLLILYLQSATNINKNAFKDSSVEYLKFEKAETIQSLPDTLQGILLPSTVTSITATTPDTDFIVYGYENTYAQEYANTNEKEFKTIPVIHHTSTEQVSVDDKYIAVFALGFNCEYQWYRNDTVSNEGGTPIEGATNFYYEPIAGEKSAAYYCVITSSDGTYVNSVTSAPILNAPEFRDADFSEYETVKREAEALDREIYNEELLNELDELLNTDVSDLTLSQQDTLDSLVSQIKETIEKIKSSFVMGDLNGDGQVSAIDVRFALKYVAGIQEFSKAEFLAGDMDENGEITAVDARLIMQKALEL